MIRMSWMVPGLVACLLLGCIDLPKESSPTRYWALSSVPGEPSVGVPDRTIAVGPVELPGYLRGLEVVQRVGLHELDVSRFDRWGDSLGDQVGETLARNLSILSPGTAASPFPWPVGSPPELQLELSLSRFEAHSDGTVQLRARWTLVRVADRQLLEQRLFSVTEETSGNGMDQAVAAMSRAVGVLADEIVAQLPGAAGN